MIRLVLGIFGVAAVLCALIVMPPFSDWRIFRTNTAAADSVDDGVDVTRNVEPTFSETGELLDDGYTLVIDDATLQETVAGVIAGLGSDAANLTPLQTLLVRSLQAGASDADIDHSLNAAAAAGEVSIPAELVTQEGRVDTIALLAAIDEAARSADVAIPVVLETDPVQETTVITPEAIPLPEPRYYTVEPGDSLGSISTEFYGSIQYDDLIFEANKNILADPDDLAVGQTLLIPEL